MRRTKVVLWVVAAACSLLILSGSSNNRAVAQDMDRIDAFVGEYGGYTLQEKGALTLDYTAIHQRTINPDGSTTGMTALQSWDSKTGLASTSICTSKGTVTFINDGAIRIEETRKCDNSSYELSISAICVGVGLTNNVYTELYCTDITEVLPGYKTINLSILKRK